MSTDALVLNLMKRDKLDDETLRVSPNVILILPAVDNIMSYVKSSSIVSRYYSKEVTPVEI